MTPAQDQRINDIYASKERDAVVRHIFTTSESSQALTQSMMIVAKLDPESRNKLESKWNVVWKNEWSTSQGRVYRKLFQW